MILYGEAGAVYKAVSCKRPKMTNRSGRTWDSKNKSIDGVNRPFYMDFTWGKNMYFLYTGIWYKIDLNEGSPFYEKSFYTKEDKSIDEESRKADELDMRFYASLNEWNRLYGVREASEFTIEKMWKEVLSANEGTFKPDIPTLDTVEKFRSIVSNPTKSQEKIINLFNGVFRKEELLSSK